MTLKFIIAVFLILLGVVGYFLWSKNSSPQEEEILGSTIVIEPTLKPPLPSTSTPLESSSPTIRVRTFIYKGSYTNFFSTAHLSFSINEGKTDVTGKISGACNGSISGKIIGKELKGIGSGNCIIWNVEKHSSATFTVNIEKFPKTVVLHFDGKSDEYTLKDSMELIRE